jgi:hypothetical protein
MNIKIPPVTKWLLFQAVSFQVMWIALIWGGNSWLPVSVAILIMHFVLSPSRLHDAKVLPLALGGFGIDLVMTKLGFFVFVQWPLWLLVLWVAFVLNLGHSMRFLRNFKPLYLIIFSAAGGIYAYWASWKFGAVDLPHGPILTLSIVALTWSMFLPLCVKVDGLIRKPLHG